MLGRAFELLPELVELRRDLHRHPELSFDERRTVSSASEVLERHVPGLVTTPVGGTGLLAHRTGVRADVVLRACLDALPIDDATGTEYASRVPGVSHACGHDAQVAALVGALTLLSEGEPEAPVAALFQPAEETDDGALAVLDDPALAGLGPLRAVVGIHGHPGLDAGRLAVQPGPVMACITTLHCEVRGQGGHGAEPHRGPDAVTAAASLVVDWQVSLARRVDARAPVVLSIGRIAGGTTSNVIPELVVMDGTLRYLDPALRPALHGVLDGVARGIEARFGVSVALELDEVVPAVVNDVDLSRRLAGAIAAMLGPDSLGEVEPSLGGDDFARYGRLAPSCYIFVGERQAGRSPYGWHDPSYDLDERSIAYAAAALAVAALDVAKGGGAC
jgi:amidohydrolase